MFFCRFYLFVFFSAKFSTPPVFFAETHISLCVLFSFVESLPFLGAAQ